MEENAEKKEGENGEEEKETNEPPEIMMEIIRVRK